MKRAAAGENQSTKRNKTRHVSETNFDNEALQRNATDLLHDLNDESGYISGHIFMTWAPYNRKTRIILETIEHSGYHGEQKHRFEVIFSGACTRFFDQLDFKSQDHVLLSLKGARVEKLARPSGACTIPLKLHYTEGVALTFVRRSQELSGQRQLVDTWYLEKDWFATPLPELQAPTVVDRRRVAADVIGTAAVVALASNPTHTPVQNPKDAITSLGGQDTNNLPNETIAISPPQHPCIAVTLPDTPPSGRNLATETPIGDEAQPSQTVPSPRGPTPPPAQEQAHPTKKNAKRERRLKRQQETGAGPSDSKHRAPAESVPTTLQPIAGIAQSSAAALVVHKPASEALEPYPQSSTLVMVPPTSKDNRIQSRSEPPRSVSFQAGFKSSTATYRCLNVLKAGILVNVIGIVVSGPSPKKSRSGDWTCTIRLVDPSLVTNDISNLDTFHINFFAQYPQWLPCPNVGEVLLLRNMKVVDFAGQLRGTGYKNKLQWAVYMPSNGKLHHGNLDGAPQSECLAGGVGSVFTPFYHPSAEEVGYLLRISDWWRKVEKKRKEEMGPVHQVLGNKDTDGLSAYSRSTKEHRLICDTGPDVPPQGYFNCTVEVLHGYLDGNRVYSLCATDYTAKEGAKAISLVGHPPKLCDFVMRFEMWDNAVEIGRTMLPGEYYLIKNARMLVNSAGYFEGKIVESKIYKLDPNDAEHNPHLKALLERKRTWEEANSSSDDNTFEHRLLRDVADNQFFNCSAEVLHTDSGDDKNKAPCIYFTDYTQHPELSATRYSQPWSLGLEGHIFKVILGDAQVEMAKRVNPGSYYVIKKLRLKKIQTGRQLQGYIGGAESLIQMLNPNYTANENLAQLIQRKEQWKQDMLQTHQNPRSSGSASSPVIIKLPLPPAQRRHYDTIKEIEASDKVPNKFRVLARVVDFWPLRLDAAIVRCCSNCRKDISIGHRACVSCDDTDYEFIQYQYQMYFLVEDAEGSQLKISVSDDCPLLKGISRTEFQPGDSTYRSLCQQLEPVLGNLIKVHEGIEKNIVVAPETTALNLIIHSWEIDDGERVYGLSEYEGVVSSV